MRDNHLAGSSELARADNDFYRTPDHATIALLERESFPGGIWEPACGDGAISRVLEQEGYTVYSSDIVDRGYGVRGVDFLAARNRIAHIITNPPYRQAQEFIEHALDCATHKVAMLLKLNFLEGQRRHEFFKRTPLQSVYVFSKRLSFDRGDEENKGNGLLAFAWYVWNKRYYDQPRIDWIP